MYYIPWKDIMDGYNLRYNKEYTDLETWLCEYYLETESVPVMGKQLGLDQKSIYDKMRSFGIHINDRGGVPDSRAFKRHRFLAILPEKMETMIVPEIMKEINSTFSYVSYLAKKHNRTFKRMPNGLKGLGPIYKR